MRKYGKISQYIIFFLVGLMAVLILLYLNYITDGKNIILEKLTQGEVLTGIIIALPTILTWRHSIESENERSENEISTKALEIVKHYDDLLCGVVEDIDNTEPKKLSYKNALKIEYIIETFNKSLEAFKAKDKTKLFLNLNHVLPVITSIDPNLNENQECDTESRDDWQESLSTALFPVLKGIIENKKEKGIRKSIEKRQVKYFSTITFIGYGDVVRESLNKNTDSQDKNIIQIDEHINFKNKKFVGCMFYQNFLYKHKFNSCDFIDCVFNYTDDTTEGYKNKEKIPFTNCTFINNSHEQFHIEPKEDKVVISKLVELIKKENKFITDGTNNTDNFVEPIENSIENIESRLIDLREDIDITSFVFNKKFYEYKILGNDRKQMINELIKHLKNDNTEDFSFIYTDLENVTFKFSRHYKKEKKEGILFSGWHSLLDSNLTSKYYLFGIKTDNENGNNFYIVIFEKESLAKLLESKNADKTGKFNFYITGFKKN